MEITWQREGNCMWHSDCPKNKWNSGIMKIVQHEETRTLLECLHCGQKGYYSVGGHGTVCSEEIKL
jgi:hypothetical protein